MIYLWFGLAVAVIILIIVVFCFCNSFCSMALIRDAANKFTPTVKDMDGAATTSGGFEMFASRFITDNAIDVFIKSDDGLRLHGSFVKNDTHKYAITCHGYRSLAEGLGYHAARIYNMGFNILAPDARGHGKSEGGIIGMGWQERRDIVKWCRYIEELDPQCDIILFGISMGAATVMMTSGEADLPECVKCVVEDCGYTSVWDEFADRMVNGFHMKPFPILNLSGVVFKMRGGYDLKEASALNQVAKSKIPILFIHGESDRFVPYRMMDELFNAASCEKERLSVPSAGHALSANVDGERYWNTVRKFTEKYI